MHWYFSIRVYSDFVCQPSAQRVASVSAIESGIRGKTKSGSVWENLSRRTSAISASSLVNLTTRTTCISSDIRLLYQEKRNSQRQIDKEIQEKEEKQDKEIQEEEEKQDKEIQEKEEKQAEFSEKEEKQNTEKEAK